MENKVKLKYIKKEGYDYQFLEVETNQEVLLKIWKDKPFKDKIKVGEIGFALLNSNWINEWQKLEDSEEKEDIEVEEIEYTEPVKEKVTPYDARQMIIVAQSAQKDAVEIVRSYYNLKSTEPGPLEKYIQVIQETRDTLYNNMIEKYLK